MTMLTNLAYFKLLKSLPEDTLSGVNSQLVLLAAAGALNKTTEPAELSTNQLLASAEFLKQQGLLDCLRSQFPNTHELLAQQPLLSSPTELKSQYSPPQEQHAAKESADLEQLRIAAVETSPSRDPLLADHIENRSSRQNSPTHPDAKVKEEPRSPNSASSPKPSFRPLNKSPPSTSSSTVHWGAGGGSTGPPPNKTCTTTTTNIAKLHPCDATSILSLLGPYKANINVESRLQKYCLKQGADGCSIVNTLTNIDWTPSQIKSAAAASTTSSPRRSYNCYWMSPVGPCNNQFLNKDDLYKHLKSHVNDLEALTPATAVLQPLNPSCSSCADKSARSPFSKSGHGRYQPYNKCTKCTRCVCRR